MNYEKDFFCDKHAADRRTNGRLQQFGRVWRKKFR
jgi:hypothetical protein